MATLQLFFDAIKPLVTLGASTNASCRQEIREVVGNLSDELDRALSLADSYLAGAQYSKDDAELSRYLSDVDKALMNSFLEHHICAGLYNLADKFNQVFDPTRFSVSLQHYREIPDLITQLKQGERAVLDDLDDITKQLRDYGGRLSLASQMNATNIKKDIFNAIKYHRDKLGNYRKQIKRLRRKLIDSL